MLQGIARVDDQPGLIHNSRIINCGVISQNGDAIRCFHRLVEVFGKEPLIVEAEEGYVGIADVTSRATSLQEVNDIEGGRFSNIINIPLVS